MCGHIDPVEIECDARPTIDLPVRARESTIALLTDVKAALLRSARNRVAGLT